ncbi:hypothetical protein ACHAW6_006335 [Cyclotella cf. meneghiniana]
MKISATFVSTIFSLVFLRPSSQEEEPSTRCVCSPQAYSLTLSLSQTCKTDTLANSPGVWTTVCSTDSNFGADTELTEIIPNVGESLVRRSLSDQMLGGNKERVSRSATDDMVPVKIISIVFAEVRSDGSLVVINKDDTHADVDLRNGSVIEFDSISKELDRDVDINDQLSRVPGGVTILLVGENSIGELVKTRILWLYDNSCDEVPLAGTGYLGWITVDSCELASNKFCPSQSTGSRTGTLFAKSAKFGKSAGMTTVPNTTLFAKTEKIAKSATAEANIESHDHFSKATNLHPKSGKAYFFMNETKSSHSMSAHHNENDMQSYLIERNSGKASRADLNSKSHRK